MRLDPCEVSITDVLKSVSVGFRVCNLNEQVVTLGRHYELWKTKFNLRDNLTN